MGVNSKFQRFREAGEEANTINVEQFGQPAKSLFTSSKVISLHHRIEITDGAGNVWYRAETKFPSLHDKTDIYDVNDRHVAHVEKKFLSLHERHFVTMEDGLCFELSNELWHIIKDITNIEGLGWQMRGNILGLNFELYDENGDIVALISQKLFSIHDKYCIDIYQPDKEKIAITILITLQHMIKDREAASSGSSASSSSSSSN